MLSDKTQPHDTIPEVVPPIPREDRYYRNLPWQTAFTWLRAGWSDLWRNPLPSLAYGIGVCLLSALVIWALFEFRYEYILFPALAGFMVVGPLIATGLYEKSRRLERGERTGLGRMVFVRAASGFEVIFMGVMLLGLFLLWLRAAVLIYALFFGMVAFPGTDELIALLTQTTTGWALLLTGGVVGALFAAFAFAISAFSVPMLLNERSDALTAMGTSMALVWANLKLMLVWGAIVMILVTISIATAGLGLIVVFPLLGHATWHAYRDIGASVRARAPAPGGSVDPI